MEHGASRRNFLKLALKQTVDNAREAAREAGELRTEITRTALGLPELSPAPAPRLSITDPPRPRPTGRAGATERTVSLDELLTLASEHGLTARLDAVGALARASVRLVHAGSAGPCEPGRSRFGGEPDLPTDVEWPTWEGERLVLLAELALAELAPLLAPGTLPARGRLLVFYAAQAQPSGMRAEHGHAVRLLLTDEAPPGAGTDVTGYPITPTAELTLPRRWAAPVVALGLDDAEAAGWGDLRDRLAGLQGTTPEDRARDFRALHRLLGWPDERRGEMPLACELLARGAELADEPASLHPDAAVARERADGWRLLLQLSTDDELSWRWADRTDSRLFVWIHEERLAAGDLSAVRAFPQ